MTTFFKTIYEDNNFMITNKGSEIIFEKNGKEWHKRAGSDFLNASREAAKSELDLQAHDAACRVYYHAIIKFVMQTKTVS